MAIIEDYEAIAARQREITIREKQAPCPECDSTGWRQISDEEGGLWYNECRLCGNPQDHKSPGYG